MTLLKRKEKRGTIPPTSIIINGKHSFIISANLHMQLNLISVVTKQQSVTMHLKKQALDYVVISEINQVSQNVFLLDPLIDAWHCANDLTNSIILIDLQACKLW